MIELLKPLTCAAGMLDDVIVVAAGIGYRQVANRRLAAESGAWYRGISPQYLLPLRLLPAVVVLTTVRTSV